MKLKIRESGFDMVKKTDHAWRSFVRDLPLPPSLTGLMGWWRYLKIRYYWRILIMRIRRLKSGPIIALAEKCLEFSEHGKYENGNIGPDGFDEGAVHAYAALCELRQELDKFNLLMTLDEWEHWCFTVEDKTTRKLEGR